MDAFPNPIPRTGWNREERKREREKIRFTDGDDGPMKIYKTIELQIFFEKKKKKIGEANFVQWGPPRGTHSTTSHTEMSVYRLFQKSSHTHSSFPGDLWQLHILHRPMSVNGGHHMMMMKCLISLDI